MHRLDVQVEREVPVFVRAMQGVAVVHEACAVEQHVDGADLFRNSLHGGRIQHVELQAFGYAGLLQAFHAVFADIGRDHPGALARERHRRRAADAGTRRRTECGLALKPACHDVLLVAVGCGWRPAEGLELPRP